MSALFVRSDLERCARLAAREMQRHPGGDPELAVMTAVETISGDGFQYYSEPAVRDILRFALGREDVGDVLTQALEATRR